MIICNICIYIYIYIYACVYIYIFTNNEYNSIYIWFNVCMSWNGTYELPFWQLISVELHLAIRGRPWTQWTRAIPSRVHIKQFLCGNPLHPPWFLFIFWFMVMTIDSWPPIDSILTVGLCYDRELCALFLFGDPREGCTNMFCLKSAFVVETCVSCFNVLKQYMLLWFQQ